MSTEAIKRALRTEIRARVASIKPFARQRRAERLQSAVLRAPALAGARLVLAYRALPDEIDVDGIVRALALRGVRVAFPSVDESAEPKHRLRLLTVGGGDPLDARAWTTDRLGIAVPDPEHPAVSMVHARELDAVLVPGRAFDARGARLGRGKGFYDGLIGRLRPDARRASLGVCFREQLVDCVPEDPHDRRVAAVVAEGRIVSAARPAPTPADG